MLECVSDFLICSKNHNASFWTSRYMEIWNSQDFLQTNYAYIFIHWVNIWILQTTPSVSAPVTRLTVDFSKSFCYSFRPRLTCCPPRHPEVCWNVTRAASSKLIGSYGTKGIGARRGPWIGAWSLCFVLAQSNFGAVVFLLQLGCGRIRCPATLKTVFENFLG